jgi:hypothetical protein
MVILMAHVAIGNSDGVIKFVDVISTDGSDVVSLSYDIWRDVKRVFGIDEDTVDAYDYVEKYDSLCTLGSRELVSPPAGVF